MPRGMGRGRGAVEKPKDFGGVMKKLVKFCSRYIPVMIFALVLGAAGTVCQIIGPDKLKDMTNEITKGLPAMVHGKPVMNSIDMDAVSRIAWLLVALYVGYALLSYLQSWLMANVTQRTAQQLREAISQKINRLPLKYFDKVSYGDVLSRITNDVDAIGQTLGQSVGSLITSITLFFGALIMMFYNNVTMTLCAIGSALLGLIIMGVIMKVSQKYFTRQQVALGTDYVDFALLHRPDTLMEAEEIVEAFTTLHKAGKVRHFGVSNVSPWQAELLQSWLGDDPAMRLEANQLQFGLMHAQMVSDELMTNSGAEGMVVANHSDGLLSYSRLRHMTIQAWSPFQSGTEYGPFVGNEHFPELNKALDEKGAKHGVSANAIATAWVLRHPAKIQIVLGSMNPTRLGEMLDGADIDLDKQDWWDLYVAAGNLIP